MKKILLKVLLVLTIILSMLCVIACGEEANKGNDNENIGNTATSTTAGAVYFLSRGISRNREVLIL